MTAGMTARQQPAKQPKRVMEQTQGKAQRAPARVTRPGDGVVLYTAEEAAARLGISRTRVYYLVSHGKLQSLKIGWLRRIPRDALERFVAEQLTLTLPLGA